MSCPQMVCPHCRQDSFTRIRRWYLGRTTVWWCDFCAEMIPTLSLVTALPEELEPAFESRIVDEIRRAHDQAVETACEMAIQGGKHGVMVDLEKGAAWVDPRVPYGQLWHFPNGGSDNAYDPDHG